MLLWKEGGGRARRDAGAEFYETPKVIATRGRLEWEKGLNVASKGKILHQILLKSSVTVLWCEKGDGGRPWHAPRLLLLCVFAWLTPCFGLQTQIHTQIHTQTHIHPLSFTHRHTKTTLIHSDIETRTHTHTYTQTYKQRGDFQLHRKYESLLDPQSSSSVVYLRL